MQFEQEATAIRYFTTLLIPGMLQTASYASTILNLHITGLSEAYGDDPTLENLHKAAGELTG